MTKYVLVLAVAVAALAHAAAAHPTKERLTGVPDTDQETLIPGWAVVRDGIVYYTTRDEHGVRTRCVGKMDSWFTEYFGTSVEWTSCWTEESEKGADPR